MSLGGFKCHFVRIPSAQDGLDRIDVDIECYIPAMLEANRRSLRFRTRLELTRSQFDRLVGVESVGVEMMALLYHQIQEDLQTFLRASRN